MPSVVSVLLMTRVLAEAWSALTPEQAAVLLADLRDADTGPHHEPAPASIPVPRVGPDDRRD